MTQFNLKDPSLFRQQCFINGQWCDAEDGATIDVDNPSNGEIIGTVPRMKEADTLQAIAAADNALPAWRAKTAGERADLLYAWYNLMMEHQDDLGALMTLEQGKPLAESKGEIAYAASFIKWFAEEARRAYGDTIPGAKPGQHIIVIKQAIGVTAAITPWNFPASMITRKAGAALAAGCTMVVKPASATPYSAFALAELAQRAGIPAGVINIITGSAAAIADTITSSPVVRKVSFTGSTEVGSQLMANCAEHIQKVSLELGGNAPFLVFDDADLDKAVEGAIASKFRNTGQTCVCVNRFLVQDGVHDAFVEKLKAAMEKLKVGDGFEEGVTQAPLINAGAAKKVLEHIEDAKSKGAKVVLGGGAHERGGNFVQPTLITGATADMEFCHEETFGPLAAVIRFKDEQEGIRIANDTPFGLASYFYSENIHRVWRVAEALEAGMVGINEGLISNAAAPFGGVKESGLGREGSHQGMEEYMEVKYLCMG
ncbi:MAG: NAD-dependent succinate-semialdehyde dehydrogenase [Alloalcanivorax venustensis]|jgi:succinate-semialdehyde dehydrogenase/glutarate-semialdehyde dehydrogenase|uniref:NAD-dependent succinate-semialdehyde dehydrogenase n=1 Tax=Alloalcanivorax venustensis TaxID=172371 RepID=UPI00079B9621|nr:MAG: NAD-dependent succinate-semialdehyde dehydrogenase [Alcanivorax sp. Nap_24]MCH9783989.1 NAD-dependent succinate-semialdehyde dehydrogenase [Gammaproteobacteria bacterium]NQY83868.1 NAD-dependent succinate-semialdehyde dehydrogenase [Alcanivorax sp.]SMO68933.1 succinate semialdehyde dehydrogenase [Alcanivorax sp. DSM 26295]